jgi:hypothetical protein
MSPFVFCKGELPSEPLNLDSRLSHRESRADFSSRTTGPPVASQIEPTYLLPSVQQSESLGKRFPSIPKVPTVRP